ncbi:MAG: AAA family ATPase [Halanaeroarchaeum sp.]
MIEDPTVLQETFVPRGELFLHRHRELERIARALQPIEHGRPGETVFLFGPSGTGKTTTAKAAVGQLEAEVPAVETSYIDTWQQTRRGSVLYSLVDDLMQAPDIHRQSTPQEEIYDRLREMDHQSVVVMDEVDHLAVESGSVLREGRRASRRIAGDDSPVLRQG